MAVINLKKTLTPEQEDWLLKHIGPRMFYFHNAIGGEGWVVKKIYDTELKGVTWQLFIQDEELATFFMLKHL